MYLRFSLSLQNLEDLQKRAKNNAFKKFGGLWNAQDELSPQAVRLFVVARHAGKAEGRSFFAPLPVAYVVKQHGGQ